MKNRNIFINCPYDEDYRPLMHIIIYMVCKFDHNPLLSGQYSDSGDRMSKIVDLIKNSYIGIHDISLMELDEKNKLARFNMPFELGVDYASLKFINNEKKLLVLEKEPYLSKKALSDMGGSDIVPHKNDPEEIIKSIRNFFVDLYNLKNIKYQAAIMIEYQTSFELWLRDKLTKLGYPKQYMSMNVSITDFVNNVKEFFDENPNLKIVIK